LLWTLTPGRTSTKQCGGPTVVVRTRYFGLRPAWQSSAGCSLFAIRRARKTAQQCGFTKIELSFDVTACFVDQLPALQLLKNLPALRIDEQRLNFVI
jgi:hypothetical protein